MNRWPEPPRVPETARVAFAPTLESVGFEVAVFVMVGAVGATVGVEITMPFEPAVPLP